MRRAMALALVLLAAAVPAAGALTYREQRALQVAQAKWKRLPCGGNISFTSGVFDPSVFAPDVAGQAQPPCTIALNAPRADALIWPFYCTLIVHEVGHLLGYAHSSDPRSVMYPHPGVYWRCKHSPSWQPAT